MSKNFISDYVFGRKSPKEIVEQASNGVKAIIEDKSVKKTEVIREGGFVHGRIYPVNKN